MCLHKQWDISLPTPTCNGITYINTRNNTTKKTRLQNYLTVFYCHAIVSSVIKEYKGIDIMGVFMYVIGVASVSMLFADLVELTKTIPVLKSIVTIIICLLIVYLLIMQYKICKKIKNEKIRNK